MSAETKYDVSMSKVKPDKVVLSTRQAQKLEMLTNVSAEQWRKGTIAELAEELKWKVDPILFTFLQICGKVVKTDPVTGLDQPVPYATVHVEDTDCNLLGLFPAGSPWAWFFPFWCHREVIATTTTYACGDFCVWIPRFEIDWVVRWRLERHCYPELFVKPSIRDILEHYKIIQYEPRLPDPNPDPGSFLLSDGGVKLRQVETILGKTTTMKLALADDKAMFGGTNMQFLEVFDQPAFVEPVPPPVPEALHKLHEDYLHEGPKALAEQLGIPAEQIEQFDLREYLGPFPRWHCKYNFQAELVPILDVPDITFRVTQDVNDDGAEEAIYAEGYFDVRWTAGVIPFVTLHTSPLVI